MTRFSELRERMLADPAVRAEYERLAPEFELAAEMIKARAEAGLTQAEVAQRMGTTQSAVARMESGRNVRSDKLMQYAKALGRRVALV